RIALELLVNELRALDGFALVVRKAGLADAVGRLLRARFHEGRKLEALEPAKRGLAVRNHETWDAYPVVCEYFLVIALSLQSISTGTVPHLRLYLWIASFSMSRRLRRGAAPARLPKGHPRVCSTKPSGAIFTKFNTAAFDSRDRLTSRT